MPRTKIVPPPSGGGEPIINTVPHTEQGGSPTTNTANRKHTSGKGGRAKKSGPHRVLRYGWNTWFMIYILVGHYRDFVIRDSVTGL